MGIRRASDGELSQFANDLDEERKVARAQVWRAMLAHTLLGLPLAALIVWSHSVIKSIGEPSFQPAFDLALTGSGSLGTVLALAGVNLTINLMQAAWTNQGKGLSDGAIVVWNRVITLVAFMASALAVALAVVATIVSWRDQAPELIGCWLGAATAVALGSATSLNRPITQLNRAASLRTAGDRLARARATIDSLTAAGYRSSPGWRPLVIGAAVTSAIAILPSLAIWSIAIVPRFRAAIWHRYVLLILATYAVGCLLVVVLAIAERERLIANATRANRKPRRVSHGTLVGVTVVCTMLVLTSIAAGLPIVGLAVASLVAGLWFASWLSARRVERRACRSPLGLWIGGMTLQALGARESLLFQDVRTAQQAARRVLAERNSGAIPKILRSRRPTVRAMRSPRRRSVSRR